MRKMTQKTKNTGFPERFVRDGLLTLAALTALFLARFEGQAQAASAVEGLFAGQPSDERERGYSAQRWGAPAHAPWGVMDFQMFVRPYNAPGHVYQVGPDHVFYFRDQLCFRVRPSVTGYLYLIHVSSRGDVTRLPVGRGDSTEAYVWARHWQTVPSGPWFVFDSMPGLERLYFVFSRRRLDDPVVAALGPYPPAPLWIRSGASESGRQGGAGRPRSSGQSLMESLFQTPGASAAASEDDPPSSPRPDWADEPAEARGILPPGPVQPEEYTVQLLILRHY